MLSTRESWRLCTIVSIVHWEAHPFRYGFKHANIQTTTFPAVPRYVMAARMLLYAIVLAAISAILMPDFASDSGEPVTERNPDSA